MAVISESTLRRAVLTPEEYLAIERQAEYKHEYVAGSVVAMPGGSREHNLIVANLVRELGLQLKGRAGEVYPSDMRVWIPAARRYTYPDVSVVRGEPRFQGDRSDVLLNPTLVVEVLSPGTESYDRGEKFRHYRGVPSIEEYLLVLQAERAIERYARSAGGGRWRRTDVANPSDVIELTSIGCALAMTEIYYKVPFASASMRSTRSP